MITHILLLTYVVNASALWKGFNTPKAKVTNTIIDNSLENRLIDILQSNDVKGRGQSSSESTSKEIEKLVTQLENIKTNKAIQSPYLDGTWKLLYTSSPGTNSPIQRTFTASDKVAVYQVINVKQSEKSFLPNNMPDVSNIVCFGDKARLRVTALASTVENPLVIPRQNDGKILGLNIFGISSNTPPRDIYERIDFAFQDACFEFKDFPQFTIPYPVPFKLLGDEAKGWIDVTYISPTLRISRGNKGTTFILKKVLEGSIDDDSLSQLASSRDLKSLTFDKSSTNNTKEIKMSTTVTTINQIKANNINNKIVTQTKQITSSKDDIISIVKNNSDTVCIIFPAQLGIQEDYKELTNNIQSRVNIPCYVPAFKRLDWPIGLLPSALSPDYLFGTLTPKKTLGFYLSKIDDAVSQALKENPDTKNIVLVAHSIGGWIARAWLSEWCQDPFIKSRVKLMITLGSPHNPPPENASTIVSSLDQTRGLLSYINTNYPGAYESSVQYVTVAGSSLIGSSPFQSSKPTVTSSNSDSDSASDSDTSSTNNNNSIEKNKDLIQQFEELIAYISYYFLCGNGEVPGDGIIPVETCKLSGAELIVIPEAKHSNFVPTPGQSVQIPFTWYGSDDVLDKWVSIIDKVVQENRQSPLKSTLNSNKAKTSASSNSFFSFFK